MFWHRQCKVRDVENVRFVLLRMVCRKLDLNAKEVAAQLVRFTGGLSPQAWRAT